MDLQRKYWVGLQRGVLTSHHIPEVDETVRPTSGQETAVGAKTNSIDLRKVGILWGKRRLVSLVSPHVPVCAPPQAHFQCACANIQPAPGLVSPPQVSAQILRFKLGPSNIFISAWSPEAASPLCHPTLSLDHLLSWLPISLSSLCPHFKKPEQFPPWPVETNSCLS